MSRIAFSLLLLCAAVPPLHGQNTGTSGSPAPADTGFRTWLADPDGTACAHSAPAGEMEERAVWLTLLFADSAARVPVGYVDFLALELSETLRRTRTLPDGRLALESAEDEFRFEALRTAATLTFHDDGTIIDLQFSRTADEEIVRRIRAVYGSIAGRGGLGSRPDGVRGRAVSMILTFRSSPPT